MCNNVVQHGEIALIASSRIKHEDWFMLASYPKISGLTILRIILMVDLEIIIALALMTYNVDLNAYELRLGDEKVFNGVIDEC